MKTVHVECIPDEFLVTKLGVEKKAVVHHSGKSRVFHKLKSEKNQLALVDEDPGSPQSGYEKKLKFIEETNGIKCYADGSGNKLYVLKGKLEDWIVQACRQNKIKLSSCNLPENPDDLHDVITHRLKNFDRLISKLLTSKNPAILKLKALIK
jgi:hypothetical protein